MIVTKETIPGLGYVEVADGFVMNEAMVERARSYNSADGVFTLEGGAPYPRGSAEFARAVYGLQAMMYNDCNPIIEGGGSEAANAQCSNLDGMLGDNTIAAIVALPSAIASFPVDRLVAFSRGEPLTPLSRQEQGDAAATLGIKKAARPKPPPPGPSPDPSPGPGPGPGPLAPAESDNTMLWIGLGLLGAAAAVYFMRKKK